MSPPLLFGLPITNFVWNRCRLAHDRTIQYSSSPDRKTIPDKASVHTQERYRDFGSISVKDRASTSPSLRVCRDTSDCHTTEPLDRYRNTIKRLH